MVGIGNALLLPLLLAFAATNGGREDGANALCESPPSSSSSFLTSSSVIVEGGGAAIMAAATTTTTTESDAIRRLRSLGTEKKESHRHSSLRRASVLVPLFVRDHDDNDNDHDDKIHVLLTRRPSSMKSHGGEVCLPGGKMDDVVDMGDDVRTALREAQEEVGIHPSYVEIRYSQG